MKIDSVGLEVSDTPEAVRKDLIRLGLEPGAQVVSVSKGSSAEFATLTPGDVIISVGGIAIKSADHLKKLIDKAAKDTTFMMIVKRDSAELWVPALEALVDLLDSLLRTHHVHRRALQRFLCPHVRKI